MKHPLIKALGYFLLLILALVLYAITFLLISFCISKYDGLAQLILPYILTASAIFIPISIALTYFLIGRLPKKISRIPRGFLSIAIPWFFMAIIFNPILSNEYKSCDFYTKEMNGGIRKFKSNEYNIVLCGQNGFFDINHLSYDEIRLQVLSIDGNLLAERYFEYSYFDSKLRFDEDHLIYDNGGGSGFNTKMAMPPTFSDWIRTKLPRPWPQF